MKNMKLVEESTPTWDVRASFTMRSDGIVARLYRQIAGLAASLPHLRFEMADSNGKG